MISIARITAVSGIFIGLLIFGCSSDFHAEVESDTSWTGDFAGIRMDGSGNQSIDIPDEGILCCVVQKNTTGGYLKLRVYDLTDDSSDTITNPEVWEETSEAYGHLTWCIGGD